MKINTFTLVALFFVTGLFAQVTVKTNINQSGMKMSTDLIGAFFEDINYGADGGLYAELIQNRSFEYHEVKGYCKEGPLAHWSLITEGGAEATMDVDNKKPLNSNNTNYLKLNISKKGSKAGFKNTGFFGITIEKNKKYNFSVFLKTEKGFKGNLNVQLVGANGVVIAQGIIKKPTAEWKKYKLELTAKASDAKASLYITTNGKGVLYADMVSLFPQDTYKGRENGLRKDLAQAIADMKPRFLRFPGGCISHGRGLDNAYRWKETVGPVEERTPNWNLWNYHQTYGLGFYEYFLFSEDMGAKPLPVIPVGISCQFRHREVESIEEIGPWIQDALDLIEFANGSTNTHWGGLRAKMGHPESFNMEYICLGNEEDDIPEFRVRFKMFQDTIRKYHPEIKIIGTSGTDDAGSHYESLWQFSKEQKIDMVDEHYYNDPAWFLMNNYRYDKYDRNGPKVFIGEWASRGDKLENAIVEAAYLTGVERNSDIIEFTCYAPLLCYEEDIPYHWNPDLIRFNNTSMVKTASYHVQQMYGNNAGDEYLKSEVEYTPDFESAGIKYTGKVGVATWNTQIVIDDLKVISGDKVIIDENFENDVNDWIIIAGEYSIIDGKYAQTSGATPSMSFLNKAVNESSYTITLRAMKTGGTEGFLFPFALKDDQNYYWFNLGGWNNSQHAIEKSVGGSKSQLLMAPGKIENNVWYAIKMEISERSAKFYLNDKLIFQLDPPTGPVTTSVIKDTKSNDLILKVVNSGNTKLNANFEINGLKSQREAKVITLTGASAQDRNSIEEPNKIVPVESSVNVSEKFTYNLPANSFTLIRFSLD
ncbi:MAG: carbohydrate binding domain-containing protein [Marinilabiliaceae bacterium]|nr:carbohydrate binding domain-containing protein [Marinilabiliaceae bacterium]